MWLESVTLTVLALLAKLANSQFGRFCIADEQCGPGQHCIPNQAGLSICQQMLNMSTLSVSNIPASFQFLK